MNFERGEGGGGFHVRAQERCPYHSWWSRRGEAGGGGGWLVGAVGDALAPVGFSGGAAQGADLVNVDPAGD